MAKATAHPESVGGLFFSSREEGQCVDKLSTNGLLQADRQSL